MKKNNEREKKQNKTKRKKELIKIKERRKYLTQEEGNKRKKVSKIERKQERKQ